MALKKKMATGTEGTCHKCRRPIRATEMIRLRPAMKGSHGDGSAIVLGGGKNQTWVHEACSPLKTKRHGIKTR